MKKTAVVITGTFLLIVGIWFGKILFKTPQVDLSWAHHVAKTTTTQEIGSQILFTNVRDWTYAPKKVLEKSWKEMAVDVETITGMWFVFEPFPDFSLAGHTYLTFDFQDAPPLSFSVEARLEERESYSAVTGVLREYELAYTWGTERDFLNRRALLLGSDIYMVPLNVSATHAQALFLQLTERTNNLAKNPRFYNTLTANCTNILAKEVNEVSPHHIPYGLAWNFPGRSLEFLRAHDLIPKHENYRDYNLAHHTEVLTAFATSTPEVFGHKIRELLPAR